MQHGDVFATFVCCLRNIDIVLHMEHILAKCDLSLKELDEIFFACSSPRFPVDSFPRPSSTAECDGHRPQTLIFCVSRLFSSFLAFSFLNSFYIHHALSPDFPIGPLEFRLAQPCTVLESAWHPSGPSWSRLWGCVLPPPLQPAMRPCGSAQKAWWLQTRLEIFGLKARSYFQYADMPVSNHFFLSFFPPTFLSFSLPFFLPFYLHFSFLFSFVSSFLSSFLSSILSLFRSFSF